MLPRLLDPKNEHDYVWADSAYSGECFEALLGLGGFESLIHEMVRTMIRCPTGQLDMLHLDGRLMHEGLKLLAQLIKDDTLIALDDCEGDEIDHMNLDLLRQAGLLKQHVWVEPFQQNLFRAWNLETRSVTGLLLPIKLISCTRQ